MPEVWYDMETDDFILMQKGYFEKRKSDSFNFGRIAFIIEALAISLGGGKINEKKFFNDWFGIKEKPLSKEQIEQDRKERKKKIILANKILEEKAKKKNARAA